MEQKIIRDFILGRGQQMAIGILLVGAILASSILILRRIKQEKIEVIQKEAPNPQSLIRKEETQKQLTKTSDIQGTKTSDIKKRTLSSVRTFVININKADKGELIGLPSIGPKLAERILKYRKENGPFKNKEDIMKINGIGKKKFEKCKEMIRVD